MAGGEAWCWFVDDSRVARDGKWASLSIPLELAANGLSEEDGWQQTVHHHTDGERWFRHTCGVLDSDVDPRSIAESFEFLPTAG